MTSSRESRVFMLEDDSLLQVLMSSVSKEQQSLAADFLVSIPHDDFKVLRDRVAALPLQRYCYLVKALGELPDRHFLRFLEHAKWTRSEALDRQIHESHLEDYRIWSYQEAWIRTQPPVKENMLAPPYLPPEITRMILDKYFEAVFIPGEIEPDELIQVHSDDSDNSDVFFYDNYFYKYGDELKGLNRKFYEEYKHRYWSENVLVPGRGPSDYGVDALKRLSPDIRLKIRSVRFAIRSTDLEGGSSSIRSYDREKDMLDNLSDFEHTCNQHNHDLINTWTRKASYLFDLKPEQLVLDVREAYSPHGDFLGMLFAREAPKFRYGMPQNFRVIARSQTLAHGVQRVIEDRNRD